MAFKLGRSDYERVTIPQDMRPPGSRNAILHEWPVRRIATHAVEGLILLMPWSGMVMTPVSMYQGGWNCQVVIGTETYSRTGYKLCASNWELQRAEEVWLGTSPPVDVAFRNARAVGGRGLWVLTPVLMIDRPEDYEEPTGPPVDPHELYGVLTPVRKD